MKIKSFFAMVPIVTMIGIPAQATDFTSIQQAEAAIVSDSGLLSGWINDQFKRAATFNSTAGDVVPSQLKIFGIEAGIEGVVTASKLDVNGFNNLGTQLIDTTQIKMYNRLPFPSIIAHAKFGLPFGLDGGIRLGGIPSENENNGTSHFGVQNSIFGLDVRKKLIDEGTLHPFGLTLDLNYTHAKGHIEFDTPYTAANGTTVAGQPVTLSATGNERTDWKTDSVGLQAILNKKILILNPYVGAAVNHNSGTISSSINNVGTVSSNGISQTLTAGNGASASPNNWDVRGLAGIEFTVLPFVRMGIGGEVANQGRIAGSFGMRIQFR